MHAGSGWHRWSFGPALAGLAAALLAASPAAARSDRHRHIVAPVSVPAPAAAPVDSGFGPTAPGFSAIVIDASSGRVLSAVAADTPRYPASLAKLMVLDLAFQALREGRMSLDTQIPVSYHAADVVPVKLGLQPGDTISVEQAILSMTTMSANDAATALGEYLGGGSEYRCGQMMTLRAHALGMAQTQFYNASGLPNPNQVTTARDLAILARDIVENDSQFQSFFEVQQFDFNGRTIYSNNQMLKLYPGATGLKTGYTTLAKHNLITSAVRNGRLLIGVVLHEPSWDETYGQMTAMLDEGFGAPTADDVAFLSSETADPAAQPLPQTPPPVATVVTDPPPPRPVHPVAPPASHGATLLAGWTAQIGSFSRLAVARNQAIEVAHLRGVGVPRVAKLESHGRIMWTAQLAGLTQTAAHQTCSAMAARRTSCVIIAPQSDHMADLENNG